MASVVSEAGLGVASANLSGWKSRESAEAIETIARKIAETDGGDLRGCQWEALSKNRRKKLWRKAEIIYLRESGGDKNAKRKRVSSGLRENKKARRGREELDIESCEYVLSSSVRVVVPYVHEFTTFTKKRWIGRGILDVYKDEFSAHSAEYYEEAIRQGFINVNGKRCKEINQRLLNGDKIVHRSHRHEPPVLCGPLDICHSDDDVIIVQKPSTVPVHPCGAYYHNSLTHILRKEHPELCTSPVHVVHRIDRLTSGLVLLARHPTSAKKITDEIEAKIVKKHYLALVAGIFPKTCKEALEVIGEEKLRQVNGKITPVYNEKGEEEAMEVSIPMNCKDPKDGVYQCHAEGKVAVTIIQYLAEQPLGMDNLPGSVVLCKPKTGRTHQIRLHLQYLGFPIGNDPNYGPVDKNGDKVILSLVTDMEEPSTLVDVSKTSVLQNVLPGDTKNDTMTAQSDEDEVSRLKRLCSYCNSGENATFTQVQLHHRGIWLHAYKYEGSDWTYRVNAPEWYPAYTDGVV
jgi:tRNA pseudouridine synthase 9